MGGSQGCPLGRRYPRHEYDLHIDRTLTHEEAFLVLYYGRCNNGLLLRFTRDTLSRNAIAGRMKRPPSAMTGSCITKLRRRSLLLCLSHAVLTGYLYDLEPVHQHPFARSSGRRPVRCDMMALSMWPESLTEQSCGVSPNLPSKGNPTAESAVNFLHRLST